MAIIYIYIYTVHVAEQKKNIGLTSYQHVRPQFKDTLIKIFQSFIFSFFRKKCKNKFLQYIPIVYILCMESIYLTMYDVSNFF